ncbi:MAG TPA: glucosaminidase domain-containing protein [Bacteroidales bacterium]|nr:glucosaminidase domain-containing protein [Bacteroidales bacterium]
MKKFLILNVLLAVVLDVFAQSKMTVTAYIQKYEQLAREEMQKNKIPASITMAQGILESSSGNSELARNANNHFGIKCKTEWKGEKYFYDDDEKNECFRKYPNAVESYRDHSVFLTTREYYRSLFQLDIMDYKAWAYGLKKAGYATEPLYAEMLIKIIEDNKLYKLDSGGAIIPGEVIVANTVETPHGIVRKPDSLKKVEKINEIKDNTTDFPDINIFQKNSKVLENNGVKYVIAGGNDTYNSIAEQFGLAVFDLWRYNDIKNNKSLSAGEKVYIEPKKKTSTMEFHTVTAGETMRSISQLYAVQLKELYKKNRMRQGSEPRKGQQIWLKKYMPVY